MIVRPKCDRATCDTYWTSQCRCCIAVVGTRMPYGVRSKDMGIKQRQLALCRTALTVARSRESPCPMCIQNMRLLPLDIASKMQNEPTSDLLCNEQRHCHSNRKSCISFHSRQVHHLTEEPGLRNHAPALAHSPSHILYLRTFFVDVDCGGEGGVSMVVLVRGLRIRLGMVSYWGCWCRGSARVRRRGRGEGGP